MTPDSSPPPAPSPATTPACSHGFRDWTQCSECGKYGVPASDAPAPPDETLTRAFLADLRGGADPHAIAKIQLRPATRAAFDEAYRRYLAGFGAASPAQEATPPRETFGQQQEHEERTEKSAASLPNQPQEPKPKGESPMSKATAVDATATCPTCGLPAAGPGLYFAGDNTICNEPTHTGSTARSLIPERPADA